MGQMIKDIAKITKLPPKVSLSGNSNYIRFESKNDPKYNERIDFRMYLKSSDVDEELTHFTFEEVSTGVKHSFKGTFDSNEIGTGTYFIDSSNEITIENIKECLQKNSFLKSNFDIRTYSYVENDINRYALRLYSYGTSANYSFNFTKSDAENLFMTTNDDTTTTSNDTISNGKECEIALDVYTDNLGSSESNTDLAGSYATTVTKHYSGEPIWFDVNAFLSGQKRYSDGFLRTGENQESPKSWVDAGTALDFRFVARRKIGVNNEKFYYSDILYAITGYKRNLETNDLSEYVYSYPYYIKDTETGEDVLRLIKPLTNQPVLTHVEGQKQYFNFILSDTRSEDYTLGMMYELYTQSGKLIGTETAFEQSKNSFGIVNTIELALDEVMKDYPKTGRVKIYLCKDGEAVSYPLEFRILPQCLYKKKDFAFLNSLGGWNSFNFPATEQTEFKTEANNYYATQTPESTISSVIEAVQYKAVDEQFSVKTMPLNAEVSEWLKELSASVAVYEVETGRYVVVDDFILKYNTDDDLYQYEMKYHYSDSYNAK